MRAKAQERKEEQPRPKEKKLGRIPFRERLRGRIQSRKTGQELRSAEHRATLALRSAGLGLPAPWVTPPWREGAWSLIASRDCRTSCPPEERVSLGSRLLRPGGSRLSPGRAGGTVSVRSPRALPEGLIVSVLSPDIHVSRGPPHRGNPSSGDGRADAGQGIIPMPTPTGRGADGGELPAWQLAGQTQLHQVLSGRGDACSGCQSICGNEPRTGFRRQ